MKRLLSLLTPLSIVAASLAFTALPAHAEIRNVIDKTGDNGSSYDPRGDILVNGASYDSGLIVIGLMVGAPDTLTSFNWRNGGSAILWDIATPTEDFSLFFYHDEARIRNDDSDIVCYPLQDASTTESGKGFYSAAFPPSCLGNPAWIRVDGFMTYGDGTSSSSDIVGFTSEIYPGDSTTPPPPPPPPPTNPDPTFGTAGVSGGYWMVTQTGQVHGFGAQNLGNVGSGSVDIESTPTGKGYLALTERGEVHAKGDGRWLGNAVLGANEKAKSISIHPTGNGYWVFTDKGRALNFGVASNFGDMSGVKLNGPVLGSVATPTGDGYWMVASDGGIFSFGDAVFHGSTGAMKLNKPVMAMAPAKDGSGYWLVASDGGIFAFDVPFYGSTGAIPLNKPISGMVPGNRGYMMVAQDGGIFSFGDVAFHGSLGANPPPSPVVSVTLLP